MSPAHHPVAICRAAADRVGLENAEDLWTRHRRHHKFAAILLGHVPSPTEGLRKDVRLLATPSNVLPQFVPASDEVCRGRRPRYRTLELQ